MEINSVFYSVQKGVYKVNIKNNKSSINPVKELL